MVVPIDFSGGDYSFLLEDQIISSEVDVNGNTLTVPLDYTETYLATVLVGDSEEDVYAQYTALEISSSISYDGDDLLIPGESFDLLLEINNLYKVSNTLDITIDSEIGVEYEDTDRLNALDFERYSYRMDIPDNLGAGTYAVMYTITDMYGVEYTGSHDVFIARQETMKITDVSYDACTQIVEYSVENYGTNNVVDAIIRVEQDDSLLDYDFISLNSGTGYAKYGGRIFADVTADFHVRLYDPDGDLVDYVYVDYKSCTVVVSNDVGQPMINEPVVVVQSAPVSSTSHSVSSEFWDLTEAEVAAYMVLGMVAMIAIWTLLFLIKYLLT